MQEHFNLTCGQIGNALSIYSTVAAVGFLFAIYFADKFSKKIALPASLIATGILGIYLSTFPEYYGILLVWALFGITCNTNRSYDHNLSCCRINLWKDPR